MVPIECVTKCVQMPFIDTTDKENQVEIKTGNYA